jgi:SAM-dependent methyltransferase
MGNLPEHGEHTMSVESLRNLIADLSASASSLAVLGAELQSRASGKPMHASLRPHVDAILQELGANAALDGVSPDELKPLATEIRHFGLLDAEMLAHPERAPGWTFADEDILASGGELTEGFANVLARIAPQFDDLAARLESSSGRFLDVGTGVGRLSIAMARRWPSLRVVALDTWAPSLALARANVAAAGLSSRIEIREQAGEDLDDERAFDLAWIPAPFIPPQVLARIVERVHRALKEGGWILFATAKPGTDLRAALMRLRVASWGGAPTAQDEVEKRLADVGFTHVRTLPGPPRDFKMIVAGRRALSS